MCVSVHACGRTLESFGFGWVDLWLRVMPFVAVSMSSSSRSAMFSLCACALVYKQMNNTQCVKCANKSKCKRICVCVFLPHFATSNSCPAEASFVVTFFSTSSWQREQLHAGMHENENKYLTDACHVRACMCGHAHNAHEFP